MLGGFTTYSALAEATAALFLDGHGLAGTGYALLTVMSGAIATAGGSWPPPGCARGRYPHERAPGLLIAVGGGVGAAARFLLDGLINTGRQFRLPVGTLTINITGSLLLGVIVGAAATSVRKRSRCSAPE